MAGCQRGLSLSMLANHGYNNIITCTWNIWNNTKKNNNKKLRYPFMRFDNIAWATGWASGLYKKIVLQQSTAILL